MDRSRFLSGLVANVVLLGMAPLWHAEAQEGPVTAASKVKATATATKANADGKQTVTVTLEMHKDYPIYANPAGDEEFKPARTRITIRAKEKVAVDIQYPTGKVFMVFGLKYNLYEGRVVIPVQVQRTVGATSPLHMSIVVQVAPQDFNP